MLKKILTYAQPGPIIVLLVLLGFLIFFLKDAGINDIFIVIASAVIMGLLLVPLSEAGDFSKEDIIDWKLISHLSDKEH